MEKFNSVAEYMTSLPARSKSILKEIRKIVKEEAVGAEEVVSYGMPAMKLHGMLVWYAAHKEHIGFYPGSAAIEIFKKDIKGFETSKGTIQFPYEKPLPEALIRKIVKHRVKENMAKALVKKKKVKG
jgi:uncharacterized protein YdhG (YjbR/CyaY superfamily)